MKLLGLKSKLSIAGSEWSVTRISRKGVCVTNGRSIMELSLKEIVDNLNANIWKVIE